MTPAEEFAIGFVVFYVVFLGWILYQATKK